VAGQWFAAPAGTQARTRPAEPIAPTVVTPDAATVVVAPAAMPFDGEPAVTPTAPVEPEKPKRTLEESRSAFAAVLTANGFTESDFWAVIDAHPEWGFPAEAQSIETFDEVAIAWCSKKWTRTLLPALKGGAK